MVKIYLFLGDMEKKYVIGIDEVGRGSVFGPVYVTALAIPHNLKLKINIPLRDSKKLSSKHREKWNAVIKNHPDIFYATAKVTPTVIDRINISKAANRAATRALISLLKQNRFRHVRIILDGGLYLEKNILIGVRHTNITKTIVAADEKYTAVKLASIVAKVSRDALMQKHHKKFLKYGIARHKGYGTRAHMKAISRYGATSLHRLTFLPKRTRINVNTDKA